MKKEHALYEKRVLRDVFGRNSKEERWRWRKLHNYSVSCTAPIINIIIIIIIIIIISVIGPCAVEHARKTLELNH